MRTAKFYILSFLIALTACVRDVDFKGKEPGPKMLLNSIAGTAGASHTLKLSESVFIFGKAKPALVENASLILKINGENQVLTHTDDKNHHRFYNYSYNLKAGDKIELWAESPKYKTVYATDNIPYPPEIKELKTEWFKTKDDKKSFLRTLITLKDKAEEKNYYRIVIRTKSVYEANGKTPEELDWDLSHVYVDQEILFNNMSNIGGETNYSHYYRVFSDDLFQGKEYSLNLSVELDKEDWWSENPRRFVQIELQSLSENLFRYYRSLELAMSENNFSEPVRIFSNVQGGYGIVGCYNRTIIEKELEL